jgi:1,3-beta-glucanosyltransferase GAS1
MDTFHDYNNVLGFFVGNENIAKKEDSPAAPYLKAAARDMKAYRDRKGYRHIPIGYSAADIEQLRPMLQNYLTCGGNSSEIIDFFALNSYSWCDPSTYTTSSYDKLQEYAAKFPVPIFFSETGCNVPGPRTWDDMDAIFGPDMVGDWSGVIVYEWIQEQNNYGIISYGPQIDDLTKNDDEVFDGFTRKGTPTPKSPDFQNLQTKWQKIKPTGVSKADHDPKDVSTRACPSSTEGGWWRVDGNVALPSIGQTYTRGSLPSATANPTDSSNSASSTNKKDEGNAASGDKNIAAASAALVGVMLIFTVWL